MLLLTAAFPASALGNSYNGLLYAGTLNMTSTAQSESGGFVYASQSWTAPAGVQFNGFAYTSGSFSSTSDNSVGGVSAGFGGDGSAAQPSILFPWTDDCSITNSGHYWTNTGGSTLAGLNGRQTCNTGGNTSGWNYTNAELENTNPGVNPQASYHTLWLTVFCQAGTCNYDSGKEWGTGGASVTNLSGNFADPNNQPTGSATWGSAVRGGSWYQTNGGGLTLNLSAADPAGVCALYGTLTGSSTLTSGVIGNQNPGVTNVGGEIGGEFQYGTDPCWTGVSDSGTWIVPGGMTSGAYTVNVSAANPGNYEAQGFSSSNSPLVASYSNAIDIDDSTPNLRWSDAPVGWTSQTSEQLSVSVGPSGVSTVTCTDNGTSVPAALVSGSTSGTGTTVWSVPTQITGSNDVSCTASNGDVNGALTGSLSQSFDVDATVPVVGFSDTGYTEGAWTDHAQTVEIKASGGPSGIYNVTCSVDGGAGQQLSQPAGGPLVVAGDGAHTLGCGATSNTHVSGAASYNVNIDTQQPTLTFLVNGNPPGGGYLSGTPVVTVIGSEDGGILSGLNQISCSVNGGNPFALSGINASTNYTGSFELDQNGADRVSCTGTTVAGTVQASPSAVTVNVDNPNYAPNASSLIDNGHDPYSDGPSQSQWYVTPQPVTITADNTGGSAPIAAISCKGALSGSWPISSLNTDARGGEQVTVTVSAPGGDLSCAAEDSAGNVYVLGSYLFQIDATPPKGYFVSRASWPEPDEIEIHATDNGGSGVALVRVYGQSPDVEQGASQLVGDAHYDSSTRNYVVTLPDGVAPWVAGSWKFYANVVDVAGNQGEITAGPDGSTEDLTLPLRENTAVSASSGQVAATPEVAIPDALAAAALPASTRQGDVRFERPHATIASAARDHGARSLDHALTVMYGRAITITGTLKDVTHHGIPISGAKILVYQQLIGSRTYRRLGSTRTGAAGAYRYRVEPGASRTLYVVYPGSALLRPAASQLLEHSAGSVTLDASTIRAGARLVIAGHVRGGHVPHGGLEVTIDYRQLGAPGSGTLGTIRTDRRGAYHFTQYFAASTRGLTYEVWAIVPAGQSGWPYLGASSGRIGRHVN
ncbi:MAG TPA: hypothetical protein VG228_07900 [Solirubrobacteraceae bacterium]|nr:hypothetical protein [Solirubrobacteraceae bacterium]